MLRAFGFGQQVRALYKSLTNKYFLMSSPQSKEAALQLVRDWELTSELTYECHSGSQAIKFRSAS